MNEEMPSPAIDFFCCDATEGLLSLPPQSVDVVITSPPYNLGTDYGEFKDNDTRAKYLLDMAAWGLAVQRALKENGSVFLNIDGKPSDPWVPFDVLASLRGSFVLQNTFHWIKSIAIDALTYGHFKPINSERFVNQGHEYIFHLTKHGHVPLRRTALGVPYADPSNLKRWKGARSARVHCRGNNWFIRYETRNAKGIHPACVDAETECLTNEGWKQHGDLCVGMLAAQYNLQTNKLSWAPIESIHRHNVADYPMVRAKSRHVDMLLTENHRTVVARRDCRTRKFRKPIVIRADQLKAAHSVPVAATWESTGTAPLTEDWAELIGWYVAEGHECRNGWSVEIYQSHSANPEKVERIQKLLDCVGAEYLKASSSRPWDGRETVCCCFQIKGFAAAYLRQWAPNKGLPPSVLEWAENHLRRLLQGLVDGDGHRRSHSSSFNFIQKNKKTADIVQAIGVRLGYQTSLRRHGAACHEVNFTDKQYTGFRTCTATGASIERVDYTGTIWCPRLPHGTWVARRSGAVFITGNTFPVELPSHCLRIHGVPEDKSDFVCCDPFCGIGSTAVAAVRQGIRFIGFDINAHYLDEAVRRVNALDGSR